MELIQRLFQPLTIPISKEWASILVIVILFLFFPYLVRQIDVTAAAIDPGIFSAIILAASAVLIFKALTWWLIRTIWPVFAEYSSEHFERNFKSLFSWQKVLIYLSFYLFILFSFVLVLAALI